MSAAVTRSGRSRRAPDQLCAEAVELARAGAEATALPGMVGEHIEAVADGDRVVTHYFECLQSAYRGWRWASTVARASRAKVVTLDESALLPGPGSILAPEWVPWSERLRPGDLGPGDLLPTESEDLRLEPGFTGEDAPPPNSVVAAEPEVPGSGAVPAAEAPDGAGHGAGAAEAEPAAPGGPVVTPPPSLGRINSVADELGMARPRVLSRYGLHAAADRWEESHGAKTAMAQAAPANCVSCGFLAPLAGSLRQAFGVCANEFSPADGHVVSLSYGCGGHSEAAVMPKTPRPPLPVIDETRADELSLYEADPPEPGTPLVGLPGSTALDVDDVDDIADIPDTVESDGGAAPRNRSGRKSGRSGRSGRNGRSGKSAKSSK